MAQERESRRTWCLCSSAQRQKLQLWPTPSANSICPCWGSLTCWRLRDPITIIPWVADMQNVNKAVRENSHGWRRREGESGKRRMTDLPHDAVAGVVVRLRSHAPAPASATLVQRHGHGLPWRQRRREEEESSVASGPLRLEPLNPGHYRHKPCAPSIRASPPLHAKRGTLKIHIYLFRALNFLVPHPCLPNTNH
jgi:hypothetical protein